MFVHSMQNIDKHTIPRDVHSVQTVCVACYCKRLFSDILVLSDFFCAALLDVGDELKETVC